MGITLIYNFQNLVGQCPITDYYICSKVIVGAYIFHFVLNLEDEPPDRREKAAHKRMEEQCTMKYLQME